MKVSVQMGRLSEGMGNLAVKLDRRFGWHRLPTPFGLLVLAEMRKVLRDRNLFDTGQPTGLSVPQAGDDPEAARYLTGTFEVPVAYGDGNGDSESEPRYVESRMIDGTFNDLENPLMGSTGTRFGRNFPLEHTYPEQEPQLHTPDARKVSLELHTRDEFVPATTLNVLAAAWLQFEVHDWFSHGPNDPDDPWFLSLDEADAWPNKPMEIRKTPRDPSADPSGPQTWITADSHWWDGSQIYGRDKAFIDKTRLREDGKMRVDPDGMLPKDLDEGLDFTDVPGTHWIGLDPAHALHARAQRDLRHAQEGVPDLGRRPPVRQGPHDQRALMAKIHTVDWTPAIIAHPTTKLAMRSQWWGVATERVKRRFGRLSKSEVLSGIPGSPTDHHGVPYSLTEEFVAVYRMHPLIPDEFSFHSLSDHSQLFEATFPELNALHARSGSASARCRTPSTRSASRIRGRSSCTTSPSSSSSSSGRTDSSWTCARWTSCVSGSEGSRATRSSGSSCT